MASQGLAASARQAVKGALCGDAAAIGTHWIYGKGNVGDRVGDSPAFARPDKANYVGPAYYAHGGKVPGEVTHLGAAAQTALRALAKGSPEGTNAFWPGVGNWRAEVDSAFGYGGSWVGYVDHATKDTLANLGSAVATALAAAGAPEIVGSAANSLGGASAESLGSAAYREKLEAKIGELAAKDDAQEGAGNVDGTVLDAFVASLAGPKGSDGDTQTNALSKTTPVAALGVALGLEEPVLDMVVEKAIRETQNNDESVLAIGTLLSVLRSVLNGSSVPDAVHAAQAKLESTPGEKAAEYAAAGAKAIQLAADGETDTVVVANDHFGSSCPLPNTLPCLFHALLTTDSYQSAVTALLLAGGDSAPRAAFAGAVFAAAGSPIPTAWTSICHEILIEADELIDAVLQ